jgi:DNA-binding MarR family transcriptional regulator
MSYNKITDLINMWGEFEKTNPNAEFSEFGIWLVNQEKKSPKSTVTIQNNIHHTSKWNSNEDGLKHHHRIKNDEIQISMLIGRLAKFGRLYTKKALNPLSLNLDEFTFLASILHMENPKKSDVIIVNLFEPTSGTEILRRLIKLNYVKEYANKEDKRSKLLKLTALGEKTINKAFQEMAIVGKLVSANLTGEQKKDAISIMNYLNDFHVNLYLNYKEESVEELISKFIPTN